MAPVQFSVTSGPSKFDLSNALFVWDPRRPIRFYANCPNETTFEVYVLSVQAKDGSGENWNIEGSVGKVQCAPRQEGKIGFPTQAESGHRVFIRYRTDSRQGQVAFLKNNDRDTLAALDQIVQRTNEEQFGDGRPVRR